MKLLIHSYRDAYKNIAFEEQYFKVFEEDTLRLWINPPAVVCGKHQNAYSESNPTYCNEHNIPIIRRVSGGGTVFHDLGNVNFSFYRHADSNNPINYENLKIIHKALNQLGYSVSISPRHDLFLGESKISGNAQHVSKGRVLHHGTLLYDADLSKMKPAIKRHSGEFIDKAVKSVRSSVQNLKTAIDLGSTEIFLDRLCAELLASGFKLLSLDNPVIEADLMKKYQSDEWNFGYGPGYTFNRAQNGMSVSITVERGGKITSASTNNPDWEEIIHSLIGLRHTESSITQHLESKRNATEVALLLF